MELKLTRDKVSQAMMEECLQTEPSFLPHSARPKHPKPLGHRQWLPWQQDLPTTAPVLWSFV